MVFMRILFLTHYYPPEGNAPASRVSALAKRWVAAGHEVTVVTCFPNVPDGKVYDGYQNAWTSEEIMEGVKVIRIWTYLAPNKGTVKRMINYVSYMGSAFMHCFLMRKPDVMIATSPQFFCGFSGVLLHWFRGFPFVLEIRDIWPESISAVNAELPAWMLKLTGILEKLMYRSARHIVTVGDGYVERLKKRGVPENKLSVVMNGVDRTLFYPRPVNHDLLKKYGIDGKFICSYIGTIGMACGLKTALDAAEILRKRGDDHIRILLVGDGAMKQELEADAKRRGLTNVIFTGRRPKDEIPEWIASSDVNFVHLKKSELFTSVVPSKIFESAGCGRPVLMGVEGFSRKLVMEAGMGIEMEPENPESMVDGLLKFIADPGLAKRLGENALTRFAPKYDRDSQAQKYISILKNMKIARSHKLMFL